jgi:hypothetical protein
MYILTYTHRKTSNGSVFWRFKVKGRPGTGRRFTKDMLIEELLPGAFGEHARSVLEKEKWARLLEDECETDKG